MDNYARYRVVRDADLTAPEKVVMFTLLTYADQHGKNMFPSVATIAQCAGLGRRSVFRALNTLEAKGFISRNVRSGASTVYEWCHTGTSATLAPPPVPEGHSTRATVAPKQTREQTRGNSPPSNSPSGEDYDEDQVAYFQLLLEDEPQLMTVAGSPEAALTWKLKENLDTATKSHGYRGSTRHRTIRASLAEAANRLSRSN